MAPSTGRVRVQCCTYNGHLAKGHRLTPGAVPDEDLSSWLVPTLGTTTDKGEPPAFVAIGFQEMIPLHLALAGLTTTALDLHDGQLKSVIEGAYSSASSSDSRKGNANADVGESYTLVARRALGGIALLVYGRDCTVTSRIPRVDVATAGCGVGGLMGNKGAVGIRVSLEEEEGEGMSSWTFVTAHLAAHQNQVERRNRDWRSIVERLVFVDDEGRERQLYETGQLFVFGDLNYRISLTTPRKLPHHLLSHQIASLSPSTPSSFTSLLAHDQLTQELKAGRTLQHLAEAPITFPPTYKFKVGTVDQYKDFRKRVPGWCDRILHAAASEAEGDVQVETYSAEMGFTRSDHKPVTAIFSLPSSTALLPHRSPFPVDPAWRQKQLLGFALDRLVGAVWCLVVFAGFGKDARLGTVNLVIAALAAYYRKALL
ncbi:SPOSA6832_01559, partial [Sporobolomyces salmonicolor]